MTSDDMKIVPATIDDFDEIVAMTSATRRQLASWAPTYFHPAEAADELHAGFLRFIVDSADHATRIVVSKDRIVGFFVEVEQSTLTWVDDSWLDRRVPRLRSMTREVRQRWSTGWSVRIEVGWSRVPSQQLLAGAMPSS